MKLSMTLSIFNKHPWHHQVQSVSYTSNPISNNLGEYMLTMVFTLDQPSSIINAIKLSCNKPILKESLIPFHSNIISHSLQYQPQVDSSLPSNNYKMLSPNIQWRRPPIKKKPLTPFGNYLLHPQQQQHVLTQHWSLNPHIHPQLLLHHLQPPCCHKQYLNNIISIKHISPLKMKMKWKTICHNIINTTCGPEPI